MLMDLNKKTMQRLALLITFALLLYWGLTLSLIHI